MWKQGFTHKCRVKYSMKKNALNCRKFAKYSNQVQLMSLWRLKVRILSAVSPALSLQKCLYLECTHCEWTLKVYLLSSKKATHRNHRKKRPGILRLFKPYSNLVWPLLRHPMSNPKKAQGR